MLGQLQKENKATVNKMAEQVQQVYTKNPKKVEQVQRVTMKDPRKVEQGKRLAEWNHTNKGKLVQEAKI